MSVEGLPTLEELKRWYVLRVFHMTGGNKVQASRVLGVNRRSMYRLLAKVPKSEPSAVSVEIAQSEARALVNFIVQIESGGPVDPTLISGFRDLIRLASIE